jgi:hypothetical protein
MSNSRKTLNIELRETITVRDSMESKSFVGSAKDFITHVISGWFPSHRKDLSPEGVNKLRNIDRKNNRYQEKITDYKTYRVIRDVDEKLTDHK